MAISRFFDYPDQPDGDPALPGALTLGADWSAERWRILIDHTELRHLLPGEHLIRRSEPRRALHVVEEGQLDVLKQARGNRVRVVARVGPGAVLGEQHFLDGLPPSADVVAATDCRVRCLSAEGMSLLSTRNPDVVRDLLMGLGRIVSVRLRAAESLAGG